MESKKFEIDEQYLDNVIKKCSTSAVGKIMKRFEVINNEDDLKRVVRELLYEEFRNVKVLIESVNWSVHFKKPSVK